MTPTTWVSTCPPSTSRGTRVAADRVATLAAFERFRVGRASLVDSAVAVLDDGVAAEPAAYPGGPLIGEVPDSVDVVPPLVYVTVQVSPVVGCAAPLPLRCAANVRLADGASVWPGASVNV